MKFCRSLHFFCSPNLRRCPFCRRAGILWCTTHRARGPQGKHGLFAVSLSGPDRHDHLQIASLQHFPPQITPRPGPGGPGEVGFTLLASRTHGFSFFSEKMSTCKHSLHGVGKSPSNRVTISIPEQTKTDTKKLTQHDVFRFSYEVGHSREKKEGMFPEFIFPPDISLTGP